MGGVRAGSLYGTLEMLILRALELAGGDPRAVVYVPYDGGGKAMAGILTGETQVLSIALYDYVESLQFAEAHRLAGGLVAFSLVLLFLLYRRDRQESWRVQA